MAPYTTISWENGRVRMIDQRVLPQEIAYQEYTNSQEVADAIQDMVIRGAPAIGIAAAYGLALTAMYSQADTPEKLRAELKASAEILRSARPTAVNLGWALACILNRVDASDISTVEDIKTLVFEKAERIASENAQANLNIGLNALPLVPDRARIIHHCNTGALATGEYGTALGVVRAAHEHGKEVHVYVDETRPRLQGARLTAWELQQLGIPYQIIVDGASGHIMRTKGVDLCVVGCDRVAANGDTANKIGTYNLALAAHAHCVPFYVAGPISTIDLSTPNGDAIEIEERSAREITHVEERTVAPDGASVLNIAFDVTPARYITAIITELGVAYPPFEESLARLVKQAAAGITE